MDVSVSIIDNKLETDLHCEPTDCHQFFHFNSTHPFHNKTSIVYSQGSCIRRLLSPLTFQKDLENLKTWFCKTGYPLRKVDALFKGASKKGLDKFFERPDRRDTDVALVMTYQILHAEEKSREFLHLPYLSHFVSSLRNRLVRAKVYPLTRTKGGKRYIFCWTSWCKTCSNIKQTDTFGSFVTMKVYKINYSFKCDSKCLIYLFSSKFCGIQCAGSSVDSFWWNNYKSCQRNAAALEEHATKTISISIF